MGDWQYLNIGNVFGRYDVSLLFGIDKCVQCIERSYCKDDDDAENDERIFHEWHVVMNSTTSITNNRPAGDVNVVVAPRGIEPLFSE